MGSASRFEYFVSAARTYPVGIRQLDFLCVAVQPLCGPAAADEACTFVRVYYGGRLRQEHDW